MSEWTAVFADSFTQLTQRLREYSPTIVGATVLLLVGWMLARLLRRLTVRLIGGLDARLQTRLGPQVSKRLWDSRRGAEVVGTFVFWGVLLLCLVAVTDTLGLPVLATLIGGLSELLPRVLLALLIVLLGWLAGSFARDAIAAAADAGRLEYGSVLGRMAQGVIVAVAGVTGVEQIGVDSNFLTATVTVALASLVGGTGLAFAFGARTAVSNVIGAHYVRQSYQVGQTVRIRNVEGRIMEITQTAVVLSTPEGRVTVPAKAFGEALSVLLPTQS